MPTEMAPCLVNLSLVRFGKSKLISLTIATSYFTARESLCDPASHPEAPLGGYTQMNPPACPAYQASPSSSATVPPISIPLPRSPPPATGSPTSSPPPMGPWVQGNTFNGPTNIFIPFMSDLRRITGANMEGVAFYDGNSHSGGEVFTDFPRYQY